MLRKILLLENLILGLFAQRVKMEPYTYMYLLPFTSARVEPWRFSVDLNITLIFFGQMFVIMFLFLDLVNFVKITY